MKGDKMANKRFINFDLSRWCATIKKGYCNHCNKGIAGEEGFFKLVIDDFPYSTNGSNYRKTLSLCADCFNTFKKNIIEQSIPDLKKVYSEKVKIGIVNKLDRSNIN